MALEELKRIDDSDKKLNKEKYRFIYLSMIKHNLSFTILKLWWF